MLRYLIRRILTMIPTLLIISALVFVIIQLPPGDYLESHIAELQSQGEAVDEQKIQFLREQYGLDRPMIEQYWYWLTGMLQGDFGHSFEYDLPVTEVVGDRLFLTIIISFTTILFTWIIAFPIGIYSATHQYSWGDYGLSTLGFLGLATPNFLLEVACPAALNRMGGCQSTGNCQIRIGQALHHFIESHLHDRGSLGA